MGEDAEILASFHDKFNSHEISDADEVEKSAKSFTPWFETLKYTFIQPNFDESFRLAHSVASHFRPPVQKAGALCLYVLIKEAAPAQIRRVAPTLRDTLDRLVQVGHSDVLVDLLPVITKAAPLIYSGPSCQEFHDFFMHYLETWSRDATTAVASFVFAKEFAQMTPFLGMCAARYIRPTLAVVARRLEHCKSRAHIVQNVASVLAMCRQAWPVVGPHAQEIRAIVDKAKENGEGNETVEKECSGLVEVLQRAPAPLVFPENAM
jgi:hypothetical protein